MDAKDKKTLQVMGIAAVTVVFSLFITSGFWDVFDFCISGVIMLAIIYYLVSHNDLILAKGIFVIWASLTVLTTVFLISAVAVFAGLTGNEITASIDMDNAKYLLEKSKMSKLKLFKLQFFWQAGILYLSSVIWGGIIFFWRLKLAKSQIKDSQPDDGERGKR